MCARAFVYVLVCVRKCEDGFMRLYGNDANSLVFRYTVAREKVANWILTDMFLYDR